MFVCLPGHGHLLEGEVVARALRTLQRQAVDRVEHLSNAQRGNGKGGKGS